MKVLVIGGGGREHALAWKLANDSSKPEVFCAPGNAGTLDVAKNLDISSDDIKGLLEWAVKNRPDLTVVGPEAPLCAGIADMFQKKGLRVFGPSADGAKLEGSKAFTKDVLSAGNVPCARSETFSDMSKALEYLRSQPVPIVVKADGLAAGKGVYVCATMKEAENAVLEIMEKKIFGSSGESVLIEECLQGEEASMLALVDGEKFVMLASSQDHKRVFNNDEGPNTGGMGAYSPAPVMTDEMLAVARDKVFGRTIAELKRRNIAYKGVLYAGLMITNDGPKVLEFNCRFGDPETQAVLPRMKTDLLPALNACVDGNLSEDMVAWHPGSCVCVVMASGGYPGSYEKGKIIEGLGEAGKRDGITLFHAGTKLKDGDIVTSGGRVLGVTAVKPDLQTAVKHVYRAIAEIKFDQAQYRTDIAARAFKTTER